MRLPYSIAITLAFITCLSSFMLGLGQNDFVLPLLMTVAAGASLYLTDFRRWIRLGDWTVNVLVLAIVFLTVGDLVRNRGEDLAFSIARVLVFVEMVLLFREKDPRFCWQILLISLLQVVVATVMQQSLLFGFLLIVYVFAGLCAFVLIFLQKENTYFRRHSFVHTFIDSLKAEIAARQDRGRLVRIALVTLVTGPLSLVLSFSSTRENQRDRDADSVADSSDRWKLLRSFFAVFPKDNPANKSWERIDEPSDDVPEKSSPKTWYETLWEDVPPSPEQDGNSVKAPDDEHARLADRFVPVPVTADKRRPERENRPVSRRTSRFPLLSERPAFSAGTMQANGLEGGRRELFRHLVRGTLFSLLVAVLLFCLIPRLGKLEFWNRQLVFGHDNWMKSFRHPVGAIGFKEEIRLGSLGTVLPYHREVMSVRFTKTLDRRIPDARRSLSGEVPYSEISGASVYFRGIALDHYARGVWSAPFQVEPPPRPDFRSFRYWHSDHVKEYFQTDVLFRPGAVVPRRHEQDVFFESDSDLVGLHMTIQPLDSTVFFAPWPFFCRSNEPFRLSPLIKGAVHEMHRREAPLSTTIYSTAFKVGTQLSITPCQERINRETLLQIPRESLPKLAAMAEAWDRESGCSPGDVIGRALAMEQRFLASDYFSYKLGKTTREYQLDPLEDFIDKNPVGHCEYFAGALAMMLRSVGIPSRVIVGFKTYVQGPGEQGCVVRQSDAHAWVEVFLSPETFVDQGDDSRNFWWRQGAWVRLDPTPASTEGTMMKSVSFRLVDLQQWIRDAWGEFVLNMNTEKQAQWIYGPIRDAGAFLAYRVFNLEFWQNTFWGVVHYYRSLFSGGNGSAWRAKDWILLALPVLILAAIAYFSHRLVRLLWTRIRGVAHNARKRKASVDFYVRMENILAKAGKERQPNETPRQFVRQFVRQFEDGKETGLVVDAYYRVRFGGQELSFEELNRIRTVLDRLEAHLLEPHEPA